MIYLCLHSGGIIAHKTVASALGVSALTVTNHLELLVQANLIYKLPPMEISGKNPQGEEQILLGGRSPRNAVLLRGEEVLSSSDEMGRSSRRPSFGISTLTTIRTRQRSCTGATRRPRRKSTSSMKSPKYVLPVEVKYRENADIDTSSGLVEFLSERASQAGVPGHEAGS